MVKMYPRTVKELESLIKKSRPKKGQTCDRCGRDSHTRSKCYAGTTVDGVTITTKSWKYRPKAKSKERDPRRRKSKGDKKAKRTYNRYRKGGRKGQR